MSEIDYNSIGNLRDDYQHQPRVVEPKGLVVTPNLVLKLYSMFKDLPPEKRTVAEAKKILKKDITREVLDPLSGMGFAILSEDMLNVSRWDDEYPIVLKNDIYCFDKGNIKSAELVDVRDAGSYCVWELGIVNHERDAWMRFLNSGRGKSEKQRYLDDFIRGAL